MVIAKGRLAQWALLALFLSAAHVDAQDAAPARPGFEVSTVRPAKPENNNQNWHTENNRTTIENFTLLHLIKNAYDLKTDSQVLQGPDWIDKDHFDLTAKIDDEELARLKKMGDREAFAERTAMLQSLLAERFGLRVTAERRTMPVYALLVDPAGSKLSAAAVAPPAKEGEAKPQMRHSVMVRNGRMTADGIDMDGLAQMLSDKEETGRRVVINKTGLTGEFNFRLDFAQDTGHGVPADATQPGLLTALREQLGLRLEKQQGQVPVVVVQAAHKPHFD